MQREKEEDFPSRISLRDGKISVAREREREKTRTGGKSAEMMDIIWLISQSHFYVSCLCSLKLNLFIIILV